MGQIWADELGPRWPSERPSLPWGEIWWPPRHASPTWSTAPARRVRPSVPPRWELTAISGWAAAVVVPWLVFILTFTPREVVHPSWEAIAGLLLGFALAPVLGLAVSFGVEPWFWVPVLAFAASCGLTIILYIWTNPTSPGSDPEGAPLGYAVLFVATLICFAVLLGFGCSVGLLFRMLYRTAVRHKASRIVG